MNWWTELWIDLVWIGLGGYKMIGYEMTTRGYKTTGNLLDYLTSKYNMQG